MLAASDEDLFVALPLREFEGLRQVGPLGDPPPSRFESATGAFADCDVTKKSHSHSEPMQWHVAPHWQRCTVTLMVTEWSMACFLKGTIRTKSAGKSSGEWGVLPIVV